MKHSDLKKELKSFLKKAKNPLIVVLGPTASGKTALSIEIAHLVKGEIISTDSRQIYKGMEIGTDAISEKEQDGVPHHMLGIVTPDREFSLAEYKDEALKKIEEIKKRGNIPMLVGGTGLYISSIMEGYDVPRIAPNKKLREKLYKEAEKHGNEYLHARLAKLDAASAEKIHPNNVRYVVRAIEINLLGGKNKIDNKKKKSPFDIFMVGLEWPRDELYERIDMRVDRQLERGLIDEVKKLLKKYDEDLPAMSSLGLKEIVPYIKGEKSLEECTEILKKNTRNYAKRQLTWFRRYKNINWIPCETTKKPQKQKTQTAKKAERKPKK
ncbi:MAG TPA: tRNA (adenosine(37)-N6)-dimethylallyltransferase MiaA [Candidatus Gracilibacteria bacterium]|nr:tRNA (adenosine(37)-N6)-dimethylallyltransferase MiaA [Candidatus Gracilibacteria bacterium]